LARAIGEIRRAGSAGPGKNLAVVGWEDVPDLSTLRTRAVLYRALETTYADEKGKTLSNWESQLWPFAHSMAEGDLVVMPLKNRAAISIGRVTGSYTYRTDLGGATHTRLVKWAREVPRSTFAQSHNLRTLHLPCQNTNHSTT
jgi:restriction system protein